MSTLHYNRLSTLSATASTASTAITTTAGGGAGSSTMTSANNTSSQYKVPAATNASTTNTSSSSNNNGNNSNSLAAQESPIIIQATLRKLKTMKKKIFVLYGESQTKAARLEYYDNEKKFKSRTPKRTIVINSCFNINRRIDIKNKLVIALYTKDDCFCIVFETENELDTWLRHLLAQQRGEDSEGDVPRPSFAFIWSVQVQRKGLAEEKGIIGGYHLCLTEQSLKMVRIGGETTLLGEPRMESIEFLLITIRRCGDSQCFFYMEVGRCSAIGAGELWMETEDPLIAQTMHRTIINAMSASVKNREENFPGPMSRTRSSSANEASKPISMLQRRQTHAGSKPLNFSPSGESPPDDIAESSASFTTLQTNAVVESSHLNKNGGQGGGGGVGISPSSSYSGEINGSSAGSAVTVIHVHRRQKSLPSPPQQVVVGGVVGTNSGLGGNGVNQISKHHKDLSASNTSIKAGGSINTSCLPTTKLNTSLTTISSTPISTIATKVATSSSYNNNNNNINTNSNKKVSGSNVKSTITTATTTTTTTTTTTSLDTICSKTNSTLNNNNNYVPITVDTAKNATAHHKNKNHNNNNINININNNNNHHHNQPPSTAPISTTVSTNNVLPPSSNNQPSTDILSHHVLLAAAAAACSSSSTSCCCSSSASSATSITSLTNNYNNNTYNNNNNNNNTTTASGGLSTTGSSNHHHHVLHQPPQHQHQQQNMVSHQQQSSSGSSITTATSSSSSASSTSSLLLTRTSRNPQYPMTAPLMRPTLGYCLLSTIQQRRHSVSATTGTACHHQRALSLPSATPTLSNYGSNISSHGGNAVNTGVGGGGTSNAASNIGNSYQQQYNNRHHHSLSSFCAASAATIATGSIGINGTSGNQHSGMTNSPNTLSGIQPIHQRTRSLPLTEETAIQLPAPPITRGINRSNNNYSHHHNIKSCSQQHFMLSSTTSLGSLNNNNSYLSTINNYCNAEINNNTAGTTSMESIVEDDVVDHVSTTIPSSSTSQASTSSSPSPPPHAHLPPTSSNHHSGTFIKPSSSTVMGGGTSSYTSMSPLARNFAAATSVSPSSSSITALPVASRSTIMGRERCDSLPSRNRTISETSSVTNSSLASNSMPPPRTIPSSIGGRPHSMYNNRHSHSPPANSCPLSPSTGCSESDGSSLSIDETDGFVNPHTPDDYYMGRYTSHLTTSIPEEMDYWYNEVVKNDNDKPSSMDKQSINNNGGNSNLHNRLGMHTGTLSLPITKEHTTRKGSPAPQSVGSTEGTSGYMEMHSPCGSSPGDPAGSGYMTMSPGVDFSRGIYTSSSGAHSRASSLAEETADGYVPMGPPQTDGYVDMDPTHNHHQHHPHVLHHMSHHLPNAGGMSSAASSCSITSGTPSTDIRFAEYHLDKVTSRFTPDEDESSSLVERPIRAYSVGSRLEHNKRKLRVDMLNAEHANSRVRAFSVGSRAKVPRSSFTLHPSQGVGKYITNTQDNAAMINSTGSGSGSSTTGGYTVTVKGKKSSSAPMLSSHKSLGSVDPMDDLMEIDFSKTSDRVSNSPMKASLPVPVPITRKLDPISSSRMMDLSPKMTLSPGERAVSGYVEMKPAGPRTTMTITHSTNLPQYLTRQKAHEEEDEYLDMRPGAGLAKSPSLSSSPIKLLNTHRTNQLSTSSLVGSLGKNAGINSNDYMDMSRLQDKSQVHDISKNNIASPKNSSDVYLNMSPGDRHIDKIMEVDLPQAINAPDEYMEMSWEKSSSNSLNSNNTKDKPASEEYINIDFSRKDANSFSSTPNRENRLSSLPIAIQSANKMSSSSRSVGSKAGSGPIPGYLPLSSSNSITSIRGTSSPARSNISRTRCDSKDSGIVTPSGSQATIFPFSPGSPMKPFSSSSGDQYDANNLPRKCLVDGTSGTIRLSEEESEKENRQSIPPSPLESPSGPFPIRYTSDPTKILNTSTSEVKSFLQTNNLEEKQVDTLSNNYADMTLGSNKMGSSSSLKPKIIEYADYVNCAPPTTHSGYVTPKTNSMTIVSTPEEDMAGDYAIMDPVSARRMSSVMTTSNSIQDAPPKKSLLVTINNNNLYSNINQDKSGTAVAVSGSSPTSATGSVPLISSGFRPISSNVDEMLIRGGNYSTSKITGGSTKLLRQNTTDSSGYEVLSVQYGGNSKHSLSRPNSVNSEKICPSSKGSCNSLNRPNSANSDRLPMISASSSSSTLCGSTSSTTLCSGMDSKSQSPSSSAILSGSRPQSVGDAGSRPDSVTSLSDPHVTSRPPSVSSERELHYASLDLPPCSSQQNFSNHISDDAFNEAASPVCLIGMSGSLSKHGSLSGDSSSTSPSPNTGSGSGQQQQPAFTYAKIDFVKSENLKAASASAGPSASTSQQTLIPHN